MQQPVLQIYSTAGGCRKIKWLTAIPPQPPSIAAPDGPCRRLLQIRQGQGRVQGGGAVAVQPVRRRVPARRLVVLARHLPNGRHCRPRLQHHGVEGSTCRTRWSSTRRGISRSRSARTMLRHGLHRSRRRRMQAPPVWSTSILTARVTCPTKLTGTICSVSSLNLHVIVELGL